MKPVFALFLPLAVLAQDVPSNVGLGAANVQLERVYSSNVTERAWRRDVVTVRNGELDDPTGTLASKADIDFLSAVESGISQVHVAGTNGFNRAKANFLTTVSNHPPQNATMIAAVFRPYSSLVPEDKNVYGFLVSETNGCRWFLSKPFKMTPKFIAQDTYLDGNGDVKVTYQNVEFTDYLNDATNVPAPYAEGPWTRVIRTTDPPSPVTNAVIVRSHHLNFGNPDTGFNPGNMGIAVKFVGSTNVYHGITGTYTDSVNRIEYKFTKGAFTGIKGY